MTIRTNPCPRCGSTRMHKFCGEKFLTIMKNAFPYYERDDKDDYIYLVHDDDLHAVAQEIALLTGPDHPEQCFWKGCHKPRLQSEHFCDDHLPAQPRDYRP